MGILDDEEPVTDIVANASHDTTQLVIVQSTESTQVGHSRPTTATMS